MRADDPHADRGFSKAPRARLADRGLRGPGRYLTADPATGEETSDAHSTPATPDTRRRPGTCSSTPTHSTTTPSPSRAARRASEGADARLPRRQRTTRRDDWMLSPTDGNPYPSENSLSELGVEDGAVLFLHEPGAAMLANGRPARAVHPRRGRARSRVALGPVSERIARVLPARLSRLARCRIARGAGTGRHDRHGRAADDARGGDWRAGRVRSPRAALPRGADPRRVGAQRLRAPARSGDPRFAVAAIRDDRRDLTQGRRWQDHDHGAAGVAAGSPAPRSRRRGRDQPDWGSLGRRLVPDHQVFIDDLLAGPLADGQLSPTQIDAQLGRGPDGLMLAPTPDRPRPRPAP